MKVIKKFTAINLSSKRVDGELMVEASYGNIEREYGYENSPSTYFDTEEEAIAHAYKHNPYGMWIIAPIITFEND